MTQPFCCDITSGTTEEQNEFKRLFNEASRVDHEYNFIYYGFDRNLNENYFLTRISALKWFTRILPLSEGIAILKELVGEERPTYTEQEIDFAYLAGVFNVSGIDGLYNEIQRLKSLGKNPHDIIIEGRNQPRP